MIRLSIALLLIQTGYHAYIATIPIAMAGRGHTSAEIGIVTGMAAAGQLVGAILAGPFIDRLGPFRVLIGVGLSYLAASLLLAPELQGSADLLRLFLARLLQGAGLGGLLPAALTLVSLTTPRGTMGTSFGVVSVAPNLAYAVAVPASIAVLSATSLQFLALVTAGSISLGVVALFSLGPDAERFPKLRSTGVGLLPTFKSSWFRPLVVTFLTGLPMGVILTLLPAQMVASRGDLGSFYAAAGIATLLLRVVAGRASDRGRFRPVLVLGILSTATCSFFLTAGMVATIAGVAEGIGVGLILPAIALILVDRADPSDRGSAMSLNSVSGSASLAIGSVISGFLALALTFPAILTIATAGCVPALAIAWSLTQPAAPGTETSEVGD